MSDAFCAALLIAAPASGQGKTTLTAALARRWCQAGLRVQVFKTGPDFLDPMVLEVASGQPVYQLDLYMGGLAHCRALLHRAALSADLILIEGVMGLFDGSPSAADLAAQLDLPVLVVLDGSAMAQTFGALVHGLAHYRADVRVVAAMANRIGSATHAEMLRESLPAGMAWWGALARDERLALPERHLGLTQAAELPDLEARIDQAARSLGPTLPVLPAPTRFEVPDMAADAVLLAARPLRGRRIAIARDEAFSFIYPANLDLLAVLGAELLFFSPLRDGALPACDAIWLPGGYPELHLDTLSARIAPGSALHTALQAHLAAGKPLLAECGGMLAMLDGLTDAAGQRAPMASLLPGEGVMQTRLAGLGMHRAPLPEGELRGHAFHYSSVTSPLAPLCHTEPQRAGRRGEAVWRQGCLTASYFHAYFPSNPDAVAALFGPA